MRILWMVGALLLASGCSQPIPTAEFEALKTKICACTDVKCAEQLATDLYELKHRGGSPEDPEAAKLLLTDAATCAVKLDPKINDKIKEQLRK